MKFALALLILLSLSAVFSRKHRSRVEEGEEEEEAADVPVSANFTDIDHQVFYRILGNGVFGASAYLQENPLETKNVWLPNVCKKELNSEQ